MPGIINRREFLHLSLTGTAFLGAGLVNISHKSPGTSVIDKVKLGKTGLIVPRIAMGTGTSGSRRESNQTRIGMQEFVKIARRACDRGVKFFDMADLYGSHTFVREALKEIPRDEVILLTKIWTRGSSWYDTEPVEKTLDRFRSETGSDYFDVVLLHCMMSGNWKEEMKTFTDSLAKKKQEGVVKAVGVSCHSIDALRLAADDPWVDVIMARINPFGTLMDGKPEDIMQILATARENGKGVIGMKIFGEGKNISDDERERSLRYAINSPDIHCMTLGLESVEELDDAVDLVTGSV